ncbi:hypothetical protein AK812_SmicGene19943 [Symbiodinium microadriaticum]|uniref:Uncharacterized protein n=1 Tax=Symbiodinium microadriaticum TaxID=2951 RepID=A0A1Q9DR93_SYMMI|nr:hypothetical protein AK812_SmicGene19943 [Symbiodinium microadriaticum]
MAMMWSDLPDIPQLPQLNFVPEKDALLDSGASHALRKPKDQEEAANAERIEVILAGDERRSLRQNAGGTILSDAPSAQTILPLGALVRELGCSVKWSRKGLTLRHPAYGVLRTQIRGGCPQLAEAEALRLISDLEQKRLERFDGQLCELQAKIEAVEGSSWEEPVCKYLTQGDRKELMVAVSRLEIPDDSVTQAMYSRVRDLSKGKEWEYLKELGLSRAKRRRLMKSNRIAVSTIPLPELEFRSGGTTTTPVLAAVDAAKLEEWRLHLAAGHQPYRKDCATCVASAATGHAHRRVAHKTPCSLSLDIAGPFKKGGKSVDGGLTYFEKDVKYVLVASYRAPLTFFRPSEKPASEDTKLPDEEFDSLGVEGQAVFEEEAEEPRFDGEEEKDEEGFLLSDDEPAKAEMRKIVGPFDEVVARAPRYMSPRRRFARLDFQESQRWYDPDAATALQFPLGYPPPLQDRWEDLVIPSFDEDCLVEHFIPIALYMNRNQDWDEHSDVVFVDQDGELEPTVVARVLRYEGHVSPARNEFWYFQVHNLLEDKEETYFILEEFSTRADTANFPPRPPNLVPPPSPFDGYEPPPRLAMMQEDVDFGEYVLSEGEEHGHSNAGKPQDQESVASWLEADLENLASVSEEVLSKEALKAKVEELSKPVPQGSVILAKALVSRKGSEVLMALQEIVVQLEQYGLFVSKVHTDRAREFLSYKRVRSWLASKGIARSFTSGI